MKEEIKEKILDLYLQKLKESIVFEKEFDVNVELEEDDVVYELASTCYAETPERFVFDYDSPPEYSDVCISCLDYNMIGTTASGKTCSYYEEAEDIVTNSINSL